jgi:hypothetical protein
VDQPPDGAVEGTVAALQTPKDVAARAPWAGSIKRQNAEINVETMAVSIRREAALVPKLRPTIVSLTSARSLQTTLNALKKTQKSMNRIRATSPGGKSTLDDLTHPEALESCPDGPLVVKLSRKSRLHSSSSLVSQTLTA